MVSAPKEEVNRYDFRDGPKIFTPLKIKVYGCWDICAKKALGKNGKLSKGYVYFLRVPFCCEYVICYRDGHMCHTPPREILQ